MRGLLLFLSLLVGLSYLGSSWVDGQRKAGYGDSSEQLYSLRLDHDRLATHQVRDVWRRTSQGWEKVTNWPTLQPSPVVWSFHPALLAMWIALASIGGLVLGTPAPLLDGLWQKSGKNCTDSRVRSH